MSLPTPSADTDHENKIPCDENDTSTNKITSLPVATETEFNNLMLYCQTGNVTALEALFDTYDCSTILNRDDTRVNWHRTPLIYAIDKGQKDIVKLLLEKGVDITLRNKFGETVLMYVSKEGDVDVVKLLLDRGVDISVKDVSGWTALMYATEYNFSAVVTLLLNNGADINIQNEGGWTSLQIASYKSYYDIVRILLEYGADVNIQNKKGDTALILVCRIMFLPIEIVNLLLQYGADITILNDSGETAINVAKHERIKQYIQLEASKYKAYVLK